MDTQPYATIAKAITGDKSWNRDQMELVQQLRNDIRTHMPRLNVENWHPGPGMMRNGTPWQEWLKSTQLVPPLIRERRLGKNIIQNEHQIDAMQVLMIALQRKMNIGIL